MAANATAVWRVRPSGNNNNGGGYDAGIASAGTDFSQQNAAQVTQSGGTVSTATVTLTDTGAAFTTSLIGNGIRVSGTGITTTYTFITARPSSTTLTLQTSPGTTGTSVTYSIGGGWADFFTNTTSSGPLVPGNTVFLLGSGTPNPASYAFDYTMTGGWTPTVGTNTAGLITFANDPLTPGYKAPPDTTGGMPCITTAGNSIATPQYCSFKGLWVVIGGAASAFVNPNSIFLIGCVVDQNGNDNACFTQAGNNTSGLYGSEFFNSVALSGSAAAIVIRTRVNVVNCNIHDCTGPGISTLGDTSIIGTIVAKCNGDGITLDSIDAAANVILVQNCTIDGNTGHGINISNANSAAQAALLTAGILNNIISNHTGVGKFGLIIGAGTAAANDVVKSFVDYNVYYNNTGNYSLISAGAHDTALGSNPYVGQSTENYTLA